MIAMWRRQMETCAAPAVLARMTSRGKSAWSVSPPPQGEGALRTDLYVFPGSVTEDGQGPRGRIASGDHRSGAPLQPFHPVRPPRARMLLGVSLPRLERLGQVRIGPVLVFHRRGRVDDAGDGARARHHEVHRAAEPLGALVDRAHRGNVIVPRGLHVD